MKGLCVKNHKYLLPNKLKELMKEKGHHLLCVKSEGKKKAAFGGELFFGNNKGGDEVISLNPVIVPEELGNEKFKKAYHTKYAYYAGAMANGISSVKMVIALGKKGFMGSLGTGGMNLNLIEKSIDEIKKELKDKPYLINFLSSPSMPKREDEIVEILLNKGIRGIEASAFINITEALVYYRVSGFNYDENNEVVVKNHVIAKVSREEVAIKFMSPAPKIIVNKLLKEGKITKEQAKIAENVAMADDITVEADSGGHTDNRPLVSLLPAIMSLNDTMQKKFNYKNKVRIGAAGGISTAKAASAAFEMGADYIVTGSINQSCVEAGTSDIVKGILGKVKMQDVVMAPCADMFELGAKVQVTKKDTMFPMNAQKLFQYYNTYDSIDEIPESKRISLEKRIFHNSLENIWDDTKEYFKKVDPEQIVRAEANPKIKMALVFRWYLGCSARWAINGDKDRLMDMQIWCGQSMGAFNNWVQGTKYEDVKNRNVAEIAELIMTGAAYLANVQNVILSGACHEKISEFLIESIDSNKQ